MINECSVYKRIQFDEWLKDYSSKSSLCFGQFQWTKTAVWNEFLSTTTWGATAGANLIRRGSELGWNFVLKCQTRRWTFCGSNMKCCVDLLESRCRGKKSVHLTRGGRMRTSGVAGLCERRTHIDLKYCGDSAPNSSQNGATDRVCAKALIVVHVTFISSNPTTWNSLIFNFMLRCDPCSKNGNFLSFQSSYL